MSKINKVSLRATTKSFGLRINFRAILLCPEPSTSLGARMHAEFPLLVGAGGADRHVRVRGGEEDEGEVKLSPEV